MTHESVVCRDWHAHNNFNDSGNRFYSHQANMGRTRFSSETAAQR